MNIPIAQKRPFVLVVDGDPSRGRALHSELQAAGCYTSREASGTEALRFVIDNEPDAVVVEWSLPDMSGTELTRQIKSARFGTTVILQKEGVDWRALRQALEVAADDVLERPLSPASLLQSVGRRSSARRKPQPSATEVSAHAG